MKHKCTSSPFLICTLTTAHINFVCTSKKNIGTKPKKNKKHTLIAPHCDIHSFREKFCPDQYSLLTCFLFCLRSLIRLLRNLVLFSSFLYLCLFIFRRRISNTFLQLSGVELSPSSSTGTAGGGNTTASSIRSPPSKGAGASRSGGSE